MARVDIITKLLKCNVPPIWSTDQAIGLLMDTYPYMTATKKELSQKLARDRRIMLVQRADGGRVALWSKRL